ncbi:MAG: biotin--[acetyl-CoA-carboxylase] ligase [Bacteroidales bacterium]|nr:biotin--[acetyl-CoA-carboxylase] ligase [Bacteroidales bacterium]
MPGQIIGSRIIYLDRVSSTNAIALRLMEEHSYPEGCLFVAHTQYAGRGMGVNKWESEPGKNLTFSVVLFPDFLPVERQFMLNKMVSLALHDFISRLSLQAAVTIKWPNDIYLGERKAAGILINNVIQGASLVRSVAGIGLNINQEVFRSDAPNPVSLKNLTGKELRLERCLTDLCQDLDRRYEELRMGMFRQMDRDYLERQYRRGGFFPFLFHGKNIRASIESVDTFGRLVLLTAEGERILSDQKEITFIIES